MITASKGAEGRCLENGSKRVDDHGTAVPETEISTVPSLEQGMQLRKPHMALGYLP